MDKKTWMILLVGLIFVVLLSKMNNHLEGFDNNIGNWMSNEINAINTPLVYNNEVLKTSHDVENSDLVRNTFTDKNAKIHVLKPQYRQLNRVHSNILNTNNDNIRKIIRKNNALQDQRYITDTYIKNIDTSLEKVQDSQINYTEYKYDSIVWGIVAVGLMVVCITTIM